MTDTELTNPFARALPQDEIAECAMAAARTYGPGAAAYLHREASEAVSDQARANWLAIAAALERLGDATESESEPLLVEPIVR